MNISYDTDKLIQDVKEDIGYYGENKMCYLYYKNIGNTRLYTDYALEEDINRPEFELQENEYREVSTLKKALEIFEAENKIL